jgi:hypothetical protein
MLAWARAVTTTGCTASGSAATFAPVRELGLGSQSTSSMLNSSRLTLHAPNDSVENNAKKPARHRAMRVTNAGLRMTALIYEHNITLA